MCKTAMRERGGEMARDGEKEREMERDESIL
jgi:hypothetical protein